MWLLPTVKIHVENPNNIDKKQWKKAARSVAFRYKYLHWGLGKGFHALQRRNGLQTIREEM
jgi:hypothetical protein